MSPDAIESLVIRLYAASGGREAVDVDFEVYADALENVADDVGTEAGRYLTRTVDLVAHRPSPAMVREQAQAIMRRREQEMAAIPEATGEPVTRAQALAWVAHIRKTKGPSRWADELEAVARRQPEGEDEPEGRAPTGGDEGVVTGVGAQDPAGEVGGETPRDRGGEP